MSRKNDINPAERIVEEVSDDFVELVLRMAREVAPVRPWWHVSLSLDEKLWRWMDERQPIVTWLYDIADYMGWADQEDMLAHLQDVFTDPIEDRVPVELLVDPRMDGLIALVQSAGPYDAAQHIRRMEREVMRRERGAAALPELQALEQLPEQPPDGLYDEMPAMAQ